MRIILIGSFWLFLGLSLNGQNIKVESPESVGMSSERLDRIHSYFKSHIEEEKFAGIQTLVARKGQIVHFQSSGYADKESGKMLDPSSIFRIYSMSKPIVSVALMMLYEQGKCQLDDPIHDYIPAFKEMQVVKSDSKSGETEATRSPIRVIDLLRHTSGLGYGWGPGNYLDSLYRASGFWLSKDLEEFTEKVASMPLYFHPGEKWRYGISTDILGHLVEVLSGQSLDQYLKEHIFEPLGMDDTFFQVPTDKVARYTTNYRPTKEGGLEVLDHPSTSNFTKDLGLFSGGGGLQSTTYDYFLFCQMLLNGGELNGKRLISPKTIEIMTLDHLAGMSHGGGPIVFPNDAKGFGLGFSVATDLAATQNLGSEGAYGWGGAAGTYFVIDPKEELILIEMIQLMPYAHLNHRSYFHTLVYQAIMD